MPPVKPLNDTTSSELERIIDNPKVAQSVRHAACLEWQDREERKARNSAVATLMNERGATY